MVKLMSKAMALGAHGHIFCLDLMFQHLNRTLRAAKKNSEGEEGHLECVEEKVYEKFDVEDLAFLNKKCDEFHNREPRRRDLFHTSVSKMGIHFWMKSATCDMMVQMAEYTATGDISCQHWGWTNVMKNIPGVSREEESY